MNLYSNPQSSAIFLDLPIRMESQFCMDAVDFTRRWQQATEVLYQTAFGLVFYVAFLALFILAIRHLCLNKVSGGRSMIILMSALFVLSTTQVVLYLVQSVYVLQLLRLDVEGNFRLRTALVANRISFAQDMFLITNNALTDSLLIRRCYVIWGKRKFVTILPVIMLAATTILGYISAVQINLFYTVAFNPAIVYILSVATNTMLTTLAAGRIWWSGRDVRRNLRQSSDKAYNAAAAMILESGAIYSIFVIAFLITGLVPTRHSSGTSAIHSLLSGALPQIVNIVPTVIIVRVGLSRGVETASSETDTPNPNLSFASIRLGSFGI
ncbi:hypothetical protein MVEN_01200700 [Mycena venus]|uniref:Uncharacterized protein n=1 Tax=Mycena venus TaxID=2733690 RepID=A0A8H6Y1K1_9AGAR|nr:hypothetical protein MVEN_01200700 [Mycena venus]